MLLCSHIIVLHFSVFPPPSPDKIDKPFGMNIKLRLTEEGELEDGEARGPTLEFILDKEELLLQEEDELRGEQPSQQQQQFCSKAKENDRTEPCSADSSRPTNSGPDINPRP